MAGLRWFVVLGVVGVVGCTKPEAPAAEGKAMEAKSEVNAGDNPAAGVKAEAKADAKAEAKAGAEAKAEGSVDTKAGDVTTAGSDADAKAGDEANAETKAGDDAKAESDADAKNPSDTEGSPGGRLPGSPSPDLAVVGTKAGVVAMDDTGKAVGTLVEGTVGWCRVDPRAGVLWFRRGMSGALQFLDLEGEGPAVEVIGKTPETVVIAHGEDRLGQPESHLYSDGLLVHVADPPRVEAILGCDGDMMWYCFGDDVEDFGKAQKRRLARARKALAKEPLVGAEALAELARRSKGRRAPVPPVRSPEPVPVTAVAKRECEEIPEDCNATRRLTGTPLWLVVVGNSRGDFFHEELHPYDPKAKVFVDLRDPSKTSPKPLAGDAFIPSWVSPSGELMLGDGSLVKLGAGPVVTDLSATCGFWGGGWEIEAPL